MTDPPGATDPDQMSTTDAPLAHRLGELASLFARLGFTAFGGPAVHVALMEDETVNRRRWLDRQHFLDLASALNFIPGPNSTELAIHIGLLRAGWRGLVVAGVCFIAPAVLIILPLAWAYCRYGSLPAADRMLQNVNAVVVAVIAVAAWRFGQTTMRSPFTIVVGLSSATAAVLAERHGWPQIELTILALASLLGIARLVVSSKFIGFRVIAWPAMLMAALLDPAVASSMFWMGLYFLKVGATLFGSGYVLVSYLQAGLVDGHGWLTQRQLLDAISIGQVTPGPVLTTATFAGYVIGSQTFGGGTPGGILGGLVATIAIFLPSFVLVALFAPVLQRLREMPLARGALDGMNAAIVGLIVAVLVKLAPHTVASPSTIVFAIAGLLALLVWNVNATWIIAIAAIAGILGLGT